MEVLAGKGREVLGDTRGGAGQSGLPVVMLWLVGRRGRFQGCSEKCVVGGNRVGP